MPIKLPRLALSCVLAIGMIVAPAPRALAVDPEHREKARQLATKAIAYLKSQQDAASGGWALPKKDAAGKFTSPHLPAITALVLRGMLLDQKADLSDPAIHSAITYLLAFRQKDGGIYDRMLPSYNTALALSALALVNTPEAKEAIKPAQEFLKKLQWSEASDPEAGGSEAPKPITREHPFYGGVGYGKHGRPDNSNLNMMLSALEDSGVSPSDEAVKRAVVFLERTQMLDAVNDMPYANGSRQGGFVYATAENAESVDGRAGQSHAAMIEETLDDGTKVSRLRAYGSMTYAGFKSYLYAELPPNDIRVTAALDWIRRNYTVKENPGMGTDGVYYYYVTFARALSAWGQPTIQVIGAPPAADKHSPDNKDQPTAPTAAPAGETRDWANDLIDQLADLQTADGSFKSIDDRWMENDPVLITAYSLIALRYAGR